jgi:hypothetical protein
MDYSRISPHHFQRKTSQDSRPIEIESIMVIQTGQQMLWKIIPARKYFSLLWRMRDNDEHSCIGKE